MAKASISALLVVILNLAWWCVALALVLTVCPNSHVMTYFSADGLRFDARPDFTFSTIVYGLIILAIAEVFRTGTRLDEDQSLTI